MSVCSARLFVRSQALPMSKAFMHVSGSFLHEQWGYHDDVVVSDALGKCLTYGFPKGFGCMGFFLA